MHPYIHLHGVTDMGSPYTCNTSVRFRSVDDPWDHTSDQRYGRGVPIQVPKHVFDSGQSTIHGGTPLTGVKILVSLGWALESDSSGSLCGGAHG